MKKIINMIHIQNGKQVLLFLHYISLSEWWIQTSATCWYGPLFPLMQEYIVCASWPLAVVFAVCSSVFLWPRHRWHQAAMRSAFITANSLMLAWCVTAFIVQCVILKPSQCSVRSLLEKLWKICRPTCKQVDRISLLTCWIRHKMTYHTSVLFSGWSNDVCRTRSIFAFVSPAGSGIRRQSSAVLKMNLKKRQDLVLH